MISSFVFFSAVLELILFFSGFAFAVALAQGWGVDMDNKLLFPKDVGTFSFFFFVCVCLFCVCFSIVWREASLTFSKIFLFF